jgi:hypothetical protein
MNKPYIRATPIGYNTGKVMIGGHYVPKPKAMTSNEFFIQGVLLGRSEASGLLSTIIAQIKAKIRMVKANHA